MWRWRGGGRGSLLATTEVHSHARQQMQHDGSGVKVRRRRRREWLYMDIVDNFFFGSLLSGMTLVSGENEYLSCGEANV